MFCLLDAEENNLVPFFLNLQKNETEYLISVIRPVPKDIARLFLAINFINLLKKHPQTLFI